MRFSQKVVKLLFAVIIIAGVFFQKNGVCQGASISGNGSKSNPYIVTNHKELNYAMTKGSRCCDTTYIAVRGEVQITDTITPESGSYSIYAYGRGAMLVRSKNMEAPVNKKSNPAICMNIGSKGNVVLNFGTTGNNTITLGGYRSVFEDKKRMSDGWMSIQRGSSVTLGNNTVVQNMICNDSGSSISNFDVKGTLVVDCHMKNLTGNEAGAILVRSYGTLELRQNAIIEGCSSKKSGGAITVKEHGTLQMKDGTVSKCSAKENGGAICATGEYAEVTIKKGNITGNSSGKSGGGIFAGLGATLIVGVKGSEGPTISSNKAGLNGGGITANGGTTSKSGGYLSINSCEIKKNTATKNGGGIYIGKKGSDMRGIVYIEGGNVMNNTAKNSGGGLYADYGNKGKYKAIIINRFTVSNNISYSHGGGIYSKGNLRLRKCKVNNNTSKASGGGVYVDPQGEVTMRCGKVFDNSTKDLGKGIYVGGKLNIGYQFTISKDNEIYIAKDKFININKKFVKNKGFIATIDSQVTNEGTKLIKVSYEGGSAEEILYGNKNGEEEETNSINNNKNFKHKNLSSPKLLRSAGHVTGINKNWIIISRQYKIIYHGGKAGNSSNLPDTQYKYYMEPVILSKKKPICSGYTLLPEKTWNTKADGSGKVYGLGAKCNVNSSLDLYAVWKVNLVLKITAADRYYMVGQKLIFTTKEILKKANASDNQGKTGYSIFITGIRDEKGVLYKGAGVKDSELSNLISTDKENRYIIDIMSTTSDGIVSAKETMNLFIVGDNSNTSGTRFISSEYMYTLSTQSKWSSGKNNTLLKESLSRKPGMGIKTVIQEIK